MSERRLITCWSRLGDDAEFHHNHIEMGWSDNDAPEPRSDLQRRAWKSATWRKRHAVLNDDGTIERDEAR